MGNNCICRSAGGSRSRLNHEDEDILLQQLCREWILQVKAAEPHHSEGHLPHQGVSFEHVRRSLSFINDFSRQTMELQRHAPSKRAVRKDEFLSGLRRDFLDLSFGAENFMRTLLTNMKNLNQELGELLDALLQWTPSPNGEESAEEIVLLDKLWRFRSGQSFSEQFLQSFRNLVEQHQNVVEKVRCKATSLKRKLRTLKWLKKAISAILSGFFIATLICSIVAAAMHAAPVLKSIIAAATSIAIWKPLSTWMDGLWVERLNELQLEEEFYSMLQRAEVDKGRMLRDLQPVYSFVNELKTMLQSVSSTEELLMMKESLQNELCRLIHYIHPSLRQVESCMNSIEGRRNDLLNWI